MKDHVEVIQISCLSSKKLLLQVYEILKAGKKQIKIALNVMELQLTEIQLKF